MSLLFDPESGDRVIAFLITAPVSSQTDLTSFLNGYRHACSNMFGSANYLVFIGPTTVGEKIDHTGEVRDRSNGNVFMVVNPKKGEKLRLYVTEAIESEDKRLMNAALEAILGKGNYEIHFTDKANDIESPALTQEIQ